MNLNLPPITDIVRNLTIGQEALDQLGALVQEIQKEGVVTQICDIDDVVPLLLTTTQVAEMLNVSTERVATMYRRGEIKARKVGSEWVTMQVHVNFYKENRVERRGNPNWKKTTDD